MYYFVLQTVGTLSSIPFSAWGQWDMHLKWMLSAAGSQSLLLSFFYSVFTEAGSKTHVSQMSAIITCPYRYAHSPLPFSAPVYIVLFFAKWKWVSGGGRERKRGQNSLWSDSWSFYWMTDCCRFRSLLSQEEIKTRSSITRQLCSNHWATGQRVASSAPPLWHRHLTPLWLQDSKSQVRVTCLDIQHFLPPP